MDRVAHLIVTAGEVRRLIWASLPFAERFAAVMYRLSSSSADAFGNGLYEMFLKAGVVGMPDIHGRPASEYLGRRLPPSYGRDFGHKVYRIVSQMFSNRGVDDMMSNVTAKLIKNGLNLKPGTTLAEAENYVIKAVKHAGLDELRKKKKLVNESDMRTLDEDGGGGPGYLDTQPDEYRHLPFADEEAAYLKILDRPDIRAKLKKIHPSAEEYVRLLFEGYNDVQILANPVTGKTMLTHKTMPRGGKPTPAAWTKNKKDIVQLLRPAFDELGIAV